MARPAGSFEPKKRRGPLEFAASIDAQRAQIAKIAETLGTKPKM
jgi:hypothetical protein